MSQRSGRECETGQFTCCGKKQNQNRDEEQIDKGGLTATWDHVMSGPVLPPKTKCGSVSYHSWSLCWYPLVILSTMSHNLGTHLSKSWFLRAKLIPGSWKYHTWDTVLGYVWFHSLLQPSSVIMSSCVTIKGLQNSWGLDYHLSPCWCPTPTLPLGPYLSEWHLMPFSFIRISANTLKLRAISRSMVLLKLRSVLLSSLNVTTSP